MQNLKERAKETFDNIKLSNNQDEKVLNNIIKKKTECYFMKPIIVGAIILVFGATFSIVHANDIKHTFNSLFIMTEEKDNGEKYSITKIKSEGIVQINENADISKLKNIKSNDKIKYKLIDIENELGIKLLKNSFFSSDYITQDAIEMNNDKISQISFAEKNIFNELPNKITENGEQQFNRDHTECDMYISFKTQYYDKTFDTSLDTVAPRGSKTEEYYIDKLDTTALIVKFEPEENSHSKVWDVIFDYKNITYKFTFFFHGTDPKKELNRFMDSLEY